MTSGVLAAPVGGRRLRLVLALAGLTALGPLSIDFYLPSLPRIAEELHGTASGAQLTLTACLAGLAAGQLVMGPLSDRFGRRGPLVVGMAAYIVASLLCALAPSMPVLVVLRLLQGLAGAGGIVIARAVVRDLYEGNAAVRFFSLLMLVMGLAPILAPVIGGQLVGVVGWRGLFGVLAGAGVVILAAVLAWVPESWPPERRAAGGVAQSLRSIGRLTRDREPDGLRHLDGAGVRGDVRLHRRFAVRHPERLRCLPSGVQPDLRRQRARADAGRAGERAVGRSLHSLATPGGGSRADRGRGDRRAGRRRRGAARVVRAVGAALRRGGFVGVWSCPTPPRSRWGDTPRRRGPRRRCWACSSSRSARLSLHWWGSAARTPRCRW